jgi:hypothetical protein
MLPRKAARGAALVTVNGEGGLAFVPFCPFVLNRTFNVSADKIVIMEDTLDEIVKTFVGTFAPKVIMPEEKKIII